MREFEKRIKEKVFTTTWESETMTHSKDAILIDALEEIVEEAKKEFPQVDKQLISKAKTWNDPTVEQMNKVIIHFIDLANERNEWFVRWFENE